MYRRFTTELQNHTIMAASKLKVVMVLGSVREGRLGMRVAKFIQDQLEQKYDLTLVDPQEMDLPLLKKPLFFYQDPSQAPKVLQDYEATLKAADAYIIVSAEYNHSIPPALSNVFDHFSPKIFAYKPSGIVCYSPGIYGGMRAAMQLRSFLSEVGTLSVSNIFGIPEVHKAIGEDGQPLNNHMVKGLDKMISQLDWHAHAMKNHRGTVEPPK